MKKIISALLFTGLSVIGYAQAPSTATFNWTYSYASPYSAACSSTVTTNCIQSFVLTQGTTTVATVTATSATSYTYVLTTLPAPGTYTYSLIAVGAYQGGTINSLPTTVSLQVPGVPGSPNSFTVVIH